MSAASAPPSFKPSWVAQTIDAIRAQISSRALQVGDRLPSEVELVRQFGGGRYTVRDAVRFLVNWQLLEIRPGGGIFVFRDEDRSEAFRMRNRAGIRDHLEMQRVMEVEAARLAARRRSLADIRRLRYCLAQRGEYGPHDELESFLERDRELHMAIALASHNSALVAMYRSFSVSTRCHSQAIFADGLLAEPDLSAHAAIVEAIIYGDENAAATAAKKMLDPLIEQLSQLLDASDSGSTDTFTPAHLWG